MDFTQRLQKVIPGGSHVYAKSYDQFPLNAPRITTRGKGVYIFDESGKKYLDYGMAVRTILIGYGEKSVNQGAIEQINKGNTSSFPTMLELEAAERLVGLIDTFDMVKFCKDGSNATTSAVKLSRAYTNRKIVARCGDHPFFSYNDWFIGTTNSPRGCLPETYQFTKQFRYNDIASVQALIDEYPDQIACVILEPAIPSMGPEDGFLTKLQDLCNKNGIVFILDEMITGFRWDIKGAQHYYGVKPDLSCFGKAMANGFSVSALGGRKELMDLASLGGEDRVFLLSSTHGAEMGPLGAFMATIDFLQEHDAVGYVWDYGNELIKMMNDTAKQAGLSESFKAIVLGCLPYFVTLNKEGRRDMGLNTLFQQEMVSNGVIMRHISIAYRHTEKELALTKRALEKTFEKYKIGYEEGTENFIPKVSSSDYVAPVGYSANTASVGRG